MVFPISEPMFEDDFCCGKPKDSVLYDMLKVTTNCAYISTLGVKRRKLVQVEMCSIPEHASSKVRSLITDKSTVGGIFGNPLAIETLGGSQQLSALIFFLR